MPTPKTAAADSPSVCRRGGPDKLVESSRASLMLQGLLPTGERTTEDLDKSLLEGRYCEIRMLFYVGKDLIRWIEQSLEHVERQPGLRAIRESSSKASPPTWFTTLRQLSRLSCVSGAWPISSPSSCARWD